jgi:hypothetical protein
MMSSRSSVTGTPPGAFPIGDGSDTTADAATRLPALWGHWSPDRSFPVDGDATTSGYLTYFLWPAG